jgi:hypothetical protein
MSPTQGALAESSRSITGMSIESLAMGGEFTATPRFWYTATWYPDESAGAPGRTLSIVREDLRVSAPVYKDECDIISLSAGVRNEILDTDALIPVIGTPFPDELWDVSFGAGYFHKFENDWMAGLNVHVGSASDEPFANINQITVGATGSLRIPVRERDAWIFTLSYSNNTDFANNIPIPGVAYLWWPTDTFRALIGIPFAHIWWQPVDQLSIDLSYRFLYTVQGRITYSFAPHWKVYAGYSMGNESYFLVEAPQDDNRLFYSEQRVYGGLRWLSGNRWSVDLTSGLAFDRFYAEGRNFRENQSQDLPIGSGPYISLAFQWRF